MQAVGVPAAGLVADGADAPWCELFTAMNMHSAVRNLRQTCRNTNSELLRVLLACDEFLGHASVTFLFPSAQQVSR